MFGWEKRKRDLLVEFQDYIECETEDNIARGMNPDAARAAAHKKFGNALLAADRSREIWGYVWLERVLQDLRYAWRSLRAIPAYTLSLIGTLALGMGCIATMLAVVDSVLIEPVALPHSEELVRIWGGNSAEGMHSSDFALSYRALDDLRRSSSYFKNLASYNVMVRPLTAQDGTRITLTEVVSPNIFQVLGIRVQMGRAFLPSDDTASVVVVSNDFWRNRLHAHPNAVGSVVQLFGRPRTVIGVLPPGVQFPQGSGGQCVYTPLAINAKGEDEFGFDAADGIVRLPSAANTAQALAAAQIIYRATAQTPIDRQRSIVMSPYRDTVTGDLKKPLWTLLAGVTFLLIIASANAANLQVGRATNRVGEITLRSALGASFGRIVQQLLVESILVSSLATLLGMAGACFMLRLLRHAYGTKYSRFDELALHPGVVLLLALLAALIGMVATVAPAFSLRKQLLRSTESKGSARTRLLPRLLVSLQIALTCVLLADSGLLTRTMQSLAAVNLGFDPQHVSTLVIMPTNQSQAPELSRQTEDTLLRRIQALPGIQAATMQTSVPFSNFNVDLDGRTDVDGRAYREGDSAHYTLVSTDFVKASGIGLVQGRTFTAADESSPDIGVLVNQAFVKTFLPNRNPIGVTLRFHRNPGETDADQPVAQTMTILGVVQNEVQGGNLDAPYKALVYLNFTQFPHQSMLSQIFNMSAQYAIRSSLPLPVLDNELRSVLKSDAPSMVEMNLKPMSEAIQDSLGQRRLALRLAASFSGIALLLSTIGLYGVLAHSVSLRRREIGIRMALGSSRPETAKLILRQALRMVLLGLVPGLVCAWISVRALRTFLYGERSLDVGTATLAASLLLLTAAFAAFLPTLRAMQVDPAETLRSE